MKFTYQYFVYKYITKFNRNKCIHFGSEISNWMIMFPLLCIRFEDFTQKTGVNVALRLDRVWIHQLFCTSSTFICTLNGHAAEQTHRVSVLDTRDQSNTGSISARQVFYYVTLISNARVQCYHHLSSMSVW
jgi:hypothetical protein